MPSLLEADVDIDSRAVVAIVAVIVSVMVAAVPVAIRIWTVCVMVFPLI